ATIHCLVLYWLLSRKLRGFGQQVKFVRRMIASASLMAGAAWVVDRLLPHGPRASLFASAAELLIAGGAGIAVYLAVQSVLGSDEIRRFMETRRQRSGTSLDVSATN